jgi:hypothetical protein
VAVGDAGIVGEGGVIAVPPQRKRVPRVTEDYRPKAAFVAKKQKSISLLEMRLFSGKP